MQFETDITAPKLLLFIKKRTLIRVKDVKEMYLFKGTFGLV